MKKLVLVAFVAAVASQAAGCIISSDDTGDDTSGDYPRITATIEIFNGGPAPQIECVEGDGLRVNARLTGTQAGTSDVYDCDVVALITPPLEQGPGVYDVWVDYINDRGFVNDPSQWVVVETTDFVTAVIDADDLDVEAELTIEHGFFQAHWTIDGTETCEAGESVSILTTVAGGSEASDDIFDCTDGVGGGVAFTDPLLLDDYTIDAALLDANDTVIASPPAVSGDILNGNEYVDLTVIFEL
jgi:hypothetical protein